MTIKNETFKISKADLFDLLRDYSPDTIDEMIEEYYTDNELASTDMNCVDGISIVALGSMVQISIDINVDDVEESDEESAKGEE